MSTYERLAPHHFDPEIIDAVEAAANQQNQLTFRELADQHGIGDGPTRVSPYNNQNDIEYFLIHPKSTEDSAKVRVYQAPMGIPADSSTAMRAIRLFGSDPSTPLMVVGSPSVIGNKANRLRLTDMPHVVLGDLRPAVQPVLKELQNIGFTEAEVLGYSYGADAGAATAEAAAEFNIAIRKAALMEPAGIAQRGLIRLLRDFKSSEAPLTKYIEQTQSKPLFEARANGGGKRQEIMGAARYIGGLLRASNIEIARGLASGKFGDQIGYALVAQPDLKVTVVWGTESEIVNVEAARSMITKLESCYPQRVKKFEMKQMHHAGGDDIDLHAAMALQGLAMAQ